MPIATTGARFGVPIARTLGISAESASEIDVEAARVARESAEKELAARASSAIELTEVTREQLEAANARIQLAAGK